MSTEHDVVVVRLGPIYKHDNADTLGITEVEGRPCVVRLGDWKPGDVAVYVPVDTLVPVTDPRFAHMAARSTPDAEGRCRVRAARLRGVFSMGLLVRPDPCAACDRGIITVDTFDPDCEVPITCSACDGTGSTWRFGQEVSAELNTRVYEPPIPTGGGEVERDPGFLPVYDIESARKWHERVLVVGEEVVLTEKVHGANGRWAWHRDRLWCASRTQFYKAGESMWSHVADAANLDSRLAAACPGIAIYGEVYGQVQDLRYGRSGANLVLFDALDIASRAWLDYDDFCALVERLNATDGPPIHRVPELYRGPWSPELFSHAEGQSVLAAVHGADHVREGWVLRPTRERVHLELGRVILKRHGEGYLLRKEK